MYCNNPFNYFRQQEMAGMNMDQMYQAAPSQQPFFNQMPTMPMQPMMPMMPIMPTGIPLGTTTGDLPTNIASIPPQMAEDPVMDTDYTQGYLRTQIGKRVKIEFLIGTNMLIDREGTLVDVGISYIIINEIETDDLLLCDIYSIKFVRFYF
ncbi:MAG: hypothetical protein WBL93_02575 [Lutisporaceae bacterium]